MPGKILILETLGADYGAYLLTRGFVDLVGASNVREWPYKRTHNGGRDRYPERAFGGEVLRILDGQLRYGPYVTGSELWGHPGYFRAWKPEVAPFGPLSDDGPVAFAQPLGIPESPDHEILAGIQDGEFSLIVLNGARWHGSAALLELKSLFGNALPPVAFCDHEDYPQLRWDFTDLFSPAAYFKRTVLTGGHRFAHMFGTRSNVPVYPLPFASMWNIPWTPWAEREIDVFCVFGPTQVLRRKVKETTEEVVKRFPGTRIMAQLGHPMKHPEYLPTLARSKIVIDHQSMGTDTVRLWEASAAGCCLVSDFHLESPPPKVLPGEHYVQYENDMSIEGDQQKFDLFRERLAHAIQNDAETEARARRLYAHVRAHHQVRNRAEFVIRMVRAQGFNLRDLP